jgi:hypothetical protein
LANGTEFRTQLCLTLGGWRVLVRRFGEIELRFDSILLHIGTISISEDIGDGLEDTDEGNSFWNLHTNRSFAVASSFSAVASSLLNFSSSGFSGLLRPIDLSVFLMATVGGWLTPFVAEAIVRRDFEVRSKEGVGDSSFSLVGVAI